MFSRVSKMKLRDIEGKPSFRSGSRIAYFLWRDKEGFHLIWTTTGVLHSFRGEITGNKPLTIRKLVKLESNDKIIQPDSQTIIWDTRTQNDIDGVTFDTEEDFTLKLMLDSTRIGLNGILCGRTMRRPLRNPFTINLSM